MKVLLLMLVLCFRSSEGSEDCTDWNGSQAIKLMHNIKTLTCMIEGELMVTCTSNDGKTEIHSNISSITVSCTPSGEEPTSTDNMVMTSIQTTATDAMITTQVMSNCKCPTAESAASVGLGALVGLLVVLLVLVTTGWIWTCWTVKRQPRITTNSSDNTNSNVNLSSNPSYRAGYRQTLQDHPLPTSIPTYETIPALTNTMDGVKLDLEERENDVADNSNNREDTYHKLNRAQRDDKTRENKDQSQRSGEKQGAQGKERVIGFSSGTDLLEIQQSYATTSTECLLPNSAVSSEEERSASIGERSLEKDTDSSSAKKNNKELDGTALEHNGYHGPAENVENEQDLPRKRATPRDYEQAVPSKN